MIGWGTGHEAAMERPTIFGWVLFTIRLFLGASTILFLMIPLFLLRKLGFWRVGQHVVQMACWICLQVIGIPVTTTGKPMQHAGVVVANHSSWLDILSLNVCQRVFFVAKSEISSWPGIGIMAKSVGTIFIRRKQSEAKRQNDLILDHVKQGHKLLFFPEGTSTDGQRVLPFRSSLFQAFFAPELAHLMWVQPVTVLYHAPQGKRSDFYGWWGDMELVGHMVQVLSQFKQGRVEIVLHDPVKIEDYDNRKALTQVLYEKVACEMPLVSRN